jgi:3-methyladenine DNA glycosylase AlkD
MHPYLIPISKTFKENANEWYATNAKAYLLHQYSFFGIKAPVRRSLSKTHYKTYPIHNLNELETIVLECWQLPEREYQYFALELMGFHKKLWTPDIIGLIEYCLITKSWWETVDGICSEVLDKYFRLYPQQIAIITSRWNASDNIWLQRSSIMFQRTLKKNTDIELLSAYILHCKNSKEFFVRKAIGWALREYSKTNPEWVIEFVQQNELHPLSRREALKRIRSKE